MVSYHRCPSEPADGLLGNQTFFVSDPDSSRLYISFFELGKSSDDIQMYTRSFEFAEFFDCQRKLEKEGDLKVFYHSNGILYIFIHRFYLAIQENLFATKFAPTPNITKAPKNWIFQSQKMCSLTST